MIKAYEFFMESLPLLGSIGSLLLVGGSILGRLGQCHNAICAIQAIHPTATEAAQASLAIAVIRQHFKHQDVAQAQQDSTVRGIFPAAGQGPDGSPKPPANAGN